MRKKIALLPESLALILTFLLPLKFGATVGVPELPMSYWHTFMEILIASWPVMLFPLAAAITLCCAIIFCLPMLKTTAKNPRLYAWLWGALFLISLPGWAHATTWDFAAQNTAYLLGLLCWTLALIWGFEANPRFGAYLLGALAVGLVFSVCSALNQYFTGFDATVKYLQDREALSGIPLLSGQFGARLKEARVSGDFTVCNTYAGYLILVFPVVLGVLWRFGRRVSPPLPAQLLLTLPCAGLLLFLLAKTGSRGGALALLGGGFIVLFCLNMKRRWKIVLCLLVPAGLAAFALLVKWGRGFNSMLIRLDYFQAAARMMLNRPFTGAGWGEFLNDYLLLKNVVNDEAPHAPHNFALALGAQCGVPAFLIAMALLALPLLAAMVLLAEKQRREDAAGYALELGLLWGLGAWTLHSMMELNYETPGSLALAIALALLVLYRKRDWPLPDQPDGKRTTPFAVPVLFLLLCGGAAALTLPWSRCVIKAEMAYDVLDSATDPRFSSDPLKARPAPAEVEKMLNACNRLSPFPFAAASSYYLTLGPQYVPAALALLDKAIRRAPKRAAYYYRKYRILKMLPGRENEAERFLRQARKLSPKNPRYYSGGVTPYGSRSY